MRKTESKSTKQLIVIYLNNRGWCSGAQLENQAQAWQTKASTISRRARQLVEDGKIERRLGDKQTVQYRLIIAAPHPVVNTTLFNIAKQKKDFSRW